jgi:rRNA maturation protein Nop10
MSVTGVKQRYYALTENSTDDGKVVSPTHPPHFTPQKHYNFSASGTHFC